MGAGAAVEPAPRAPGPLAAVERRTTGTGAGAVSAVPGATNAQPGAASPFTGGGGPSIRPLVLQRRNSSQGAPPPWAARAAARGNLRVPRACVRDKQCEPAFAHGVQSIRGSQIPRALRSLAPGSLPVPALPTLTNGPDTGTRSQHVTVGRAGTV